MNLCWYILRVEEGNGFVARRILPKIVARQTLVYGCSYLMHYGSICKVLNMDDIFEINTGDDMEKLIEAISKWRNEWCDVKDIMEMETGCKCEVCNLMREYDEYVKLND